MDECRGKDDDDDVGQDNAPVREDPFVEVTGDEFFEPVRDSY